MILYTLEKHIGDGNVTSEDIKELVAIISQLLKIKKTQKDFKTTEEFGEYLTTLNALGKKILILNQSPCTLYEGSHEKCFYERISKKRYQII